MVGVYNYWLVFVSLLVAILASYTALDLASRITASKGRFAQAWLLGGAFSMGIGIWSMHFIGMLAFSLPIPMAYDVTITLVSMMIAIVVSGFALYTVSRDSLSARNLVQGGLLMGLGICLMHLTPRCGSRSHCAARRTGYAMPSSAARSSWASRSRECITPVWRQRALRRTASV
jgi:diguanylate cyclase